MKKPEKKMLCTDDDICEDLRLANFTWLQLTFWVVWNDFPWAATSNFPGYLFQVVNDFWIKFQNFQDLHWSEFDLTLDVSTRSESLLGAMMARGCDISTCARSVETPVSNPNASTSEQLKGIYKIQQSSVARRYYPCSINQN